MTIGGVVYQYNGCKYTGLKMSNVLGLQNRIELSRLKEASSKTFSGYKVYEFGL